MKRKIILATIVAAFLGTASFVGVEKASADSCCNFSHPASCLGSCNVNSNINSNTDINRSTNQISVTNGSSSSSSSSSSAAAAAAAGGSASAGAGASSSSSVGSGASSSSSSAAAAAATAGKSTVVASAKEAIVLAKAERKPVSSGQLPKAGLPLALPALGSLAVGGVSLVALKARRMSSFIKANL